MKKTTIILGSLAALVLTVSLVGTKSVYAEEDNIFSPFVNRLMTKFNIKKEDVNTTFTELRAERQQEMQNTFNERLNKAATEGSITEDQKTKILEYHNRIQEKRDEMTSIREEMQNWADSENLDLRNIMGAPRGMGNGRGDLNGMGPKGF